MQEHNHLLQILEKDGVRVQVQGNQPVPLRGTDTAWVTASGRVDIFWAPIINGHPSGPRHYQFSAEPGNFLFGLPDNSDHIFLAVGIPGTELLEINSEVLLAKMTNSEDGSEALQAIEFWICSLGRLAAANTPLPGKYISLYPGQTISVPENSHLRTKDQVIWTDPNRQAYLFSGRKDLPQIQGWPIFPVSHDFWLTSSKADELNCLSTQQALQKQYFPQILAGFGQFAQDCAAVHASQTESRHSQRIAQRRQMDESKLTNALKQLAGALWGGKSEQDVIPEEESPLIQAVMLTARATGISFVSPEKTEEGSPNLDDLARESRFRYRQVLLEGKWWRQDNGPMLGFKAKTGAPVALLPLSSRKYELVDPSENSRETVNEQNSQSLNGQAYMLYNSLPSKELGIIALMRFGFKNCWRDLGMSSLMGLITSLLGLLTPIMTGMVVDTIIPEAARGQLFQMCSILLTCGLAIGLFNVARTVAMMRFKGRLDYIMEAAIWDRLLSLPAPFFRDFTAGDLSNRSMGINTVRKIFTGATINTLMTGIFSVLSLGLMVYYSINMTLAGLPIIAFSMVLSFAEAYLIVRFQRQEYEITGRLTGTILQFITGVNKLKVSGAEERAFSVWSKDYAKLNSLDYKSGMIGIVMDSFSSLFSVLTLIIIFWWFFSHELKTLSTGQFLAFHAAFAQFMGSMTSLAGSIPSLTKAIPLLERAKPILKTPPEYDESKSKPGTLRGHIQISQVNFRYSAQDNLVLENVNLSVEPGQFMAIVGGSGSGKSTLMRLLLGFEQPESGSVFYDGQDLSTLDVREVRRQIGVVIQNAKLMQGSIFSNIAGTSTINLDQAWKAARMVGLEEDIRAMPMGMQTMISAGGGTLSGGQQQRVLIARALAQSPRILFMDEATSALDNESQKVVTNSLASLKVTRVVIAHRLTTVQDADCIAVLEEGHITESGTHTQLMQKKGVYYDLVKRQMQ
jgi:ATP-binding cassette subfamily C protein